MSELSGKVIIITGASRGIGAAAAHAFADAGAIPILIARSADQIEKIASDISGKGGTADAHACDVADHTTFASVIANVAAKHGRIDVLINNAGVIDPIARLGDSDPVAWSNAIDINVKGVYNGIHAVLPSMLKAGHGTIINISSGAATSALEGWSHYCSSKAAVLMLTRMMDREYGDQGIRCVGLSPGTVATDMQRAIKTSGINPVSNLEWDDHIPPEWPAKTLVWMCTDAGSGVRGADISLRDEGVRRAVGLI
ncbi:MAG: SDR family oxidoreductase [Pseudomonadota bacterium]